VTLPGVVDQADEQVGEGRVLRDRQRARAGQRAERRRGDADVGGEAGQARQQRERGDRSDDRDLGDGLERFEQRVGPDEVLDSRGGVDAAEVGFERWRRR
jgi:hypothetical protein